MLGEIATELNFLETYLAGEAVRKELQQERFGLEWLPADYLRQYQLYLMGLYYQEFNVNP